MAVREGPPRGAGDAIEPSTSTATACARATHQGPEVDLERRRDSYESSYRGVDRAGLDPLQPLVVDSRGGRDIFLGELRGLARPANSSRELALNVDRRVFAHNRSGTGGDNFGTP